MKTKYETIDGRIFGDITDATKHEKMVLNCVRMWDSSNQRTDNTDTARLVHLNGDNAGKLFKDMMHANPEEFLSKEEIDSMFDNDDCGWFYWDEYDSCYRYLDSETINLIIHATHEI